MATLAEMLRQGADRLVNLPSEAQRFVTNPQAFTQLLTGKNPLPRETGFAAGATGLPAQEMSVLDPNQAPYMQGYTGQQLGADIQRFNFLQNQPQQNLQNYMSLVYGTFDKSLAIFDPDWNVFACLSSTII